MATKYEKKDLTGWYNYISATLAEKAETNPQLKTAIAPHLEALALSLNSNDLQSSQYHTRQAVDTAYNNGVEYLLAANGKDKVNLKKDSTLREILDSDLKDIVLTPTPKVGEKTVSTSSGTDNNLGDLTDGLKDKAGEMWDLAKKNPKTALLVAGCAVAGFGFAKNLVGGKAGFGGTMLALGMLVGLFAIAENAVGFAKASNAERDHSTAAIERTTDELYADSRGATEVHNQDGRPANLGQRRS